MDLDPVDLNDVIRARCASRHLERGAELRIIRRFQRAVDELANASDASDLLREISAYKSQVAGSYFVPSILRCIVSYNIAARNHVRSRVRRGRDFDAALDVDLGSFAPIQGDDPRAPRLRSR